MNITKISIENNRVTILLVVVIAILGILGYNQSSRDAMPPFTIRTCQVITQFPGASPERVEKLVSDKIEKVIQEIPELKTVTSENRTGKSIIKVELQSDVPKEDLQAVWDKIRRKIDEIRNELPNNIYGPNVKDDGLGVVYGIQLGLRSEGFTYAEMEDYADEIRNDLIKLEEVSRVEIGGIREERVFVKFDNAKLAQYGLSANQIENAISNTNIVFPGGEINLQKERIALEPTGNYEHIEDIKNTLIPLKQAEYVKLSDIADVRLGYETPQGSIVKINGEKGLSLALSLKEGTSLSKLGEKVDRKLLGYNNSLPHGITIDRIASQDIYVNNGVSDFVSNVIQSIAVVLLVMLLFLGFRTGMVVASLIPITMLMSLMVLNFLGVGLNQVTLAALIMALGMLVDNSIVVSEAIMVKMEGGSSPKDAAVEASKELAIPLLISTLTTSAAFLAFFLADGAMGEMMGNIFIVITIALLSSLIIALSFVAMISVYFMRNKKVKADSKKEEKPDFFEKLNAKYKQLLIWVLNQPKKFIGMVVVAFVASLFIFPMLPFIFMPESDRNLVVVDINLPQGTKIEETEKVVDELSDFINANLIVSEPKAKTEEGIVNFTSFIGRGPNSYDLGYQQEQPNSSYAHLLLNTTGYDANANVVQVLDKHAFNNFPDADVSVSSLGSPGGAKYDVSVRLAGEDMEKLLSISESLKAEMSKIEGTQTIKDDWGPKIKKVVIDIDQFKAGLAGVTNQDIAISLKTALDGFEIGDYRELDGNIPIVLQNRNANTLDVRELESIAVFSQMNGSNVPLAQVANINIEWQQAKIMHKDLNRTIEVSCNAKPGTTAAEITNQLKPYLKETSKNWESGYSYSLGGESEKSAESMGAVGKNLPFAGFIILLLLILQFNSFRKTFIVIASIPLGIIGVLVGLFVFNSYFGFMAFLGIVSLAGIVVNNAIVLLDRIDIEITSLGKKPYQAIIDAAQERFRPILLTTFTTVLGLIPLYLGGGLMWEPMAVSIMVGLLFATMITLLFVPVLYKLLFKVKTEEIQEIR